MNKLDLVKEKSLKGVIFEGEDIWKGRLINLLNCDYHFPDDLFEESEKILNHRNKFYSRLDLPLISFCDVYLEIKDIKSVIVSNKKCVYDCDIVIYTRA